MYIPDEVEYSLSENNVLGLDRLTDGMNILEKNHLTRKEMGLAERSGYGLQPWYCNKFVKNGHEQVREENIRFDFAVDVIPERPIYLIAEDTDKFNYIKTNGIPLIDLGKQGQWIDRCFNLYKLPVKFLHTGINAIEISLNYDFATIHNE